MAFLSFKASLHATSTFSLKEHFSYMTLSPALSMPSLYPHFYRTKLRLLMQAYYTYHSPVPAELLNSQLSSHTMWISTPHMLTTQYLPPNLLHMLKYPSSSRCHRSHSALLILPLPYHCGVEDGVLSHSRSVFSRPLVHFLIYTTWHVSNILNIADTQ